LLDTIDLESVLVCLQEARVQLHTLRTTAPVAVVDALDARLQMRYLFLQAIDQSQFIQEPEKIRGAWAQLTNLVVTNKAALAARGKPVPDSFSAKLQRKLASTAPPRPIVQLSFEDSWGHMTQLFNNALEAVDVLNYTDSLCLTVRKFRLPLATSPPF
jgi:N-alpha-acetyltransferase 35, NatC auxiliary subunit